MGFVDFVAAFLQKELPQEYKKTGIAGWKVGDHVYYINEKKELKIRKGECVYAKNTQPFLDILKKDLESIEWCKEIIEKENAEPD